MLCCCYWRCPYWCVCAHWIFNPTDSFVMFIFGPFFVIFILYSVAFVLYVFPPKVYIVTHSFGFAVVIRSPSVNRIVGNGEGTRHKVVRRDDKKLTLADGKKENFSFRFIDLYDLAFLFTVRVIVHRSRNGNLHFLLLFFCRFWNKVSDANGS